jgi:hypothetical protein
MKTHRINLLVLFALAALVLFSAHFASAQGLVNGTIAKFDEPVEIPGHVLPAGTYAFVEKGPVIVQVWDKDQLKLYATLITNAAQQSENAADRQEFEFKSATPDSPKELKTWYKEIGSIGHEFIYEK